MKKINLTLVLILATLYSSACGPTVTPIPPVFQGDNPYAPQPGDKDMQRDEVTIDSSSLNLTQSIPPTVALSFAYFQPTPCHQLRVEVSGPDSQNRINVMAYSIIEKDKACVLMALATPLKASLNLGSFPGGHYILFLNGTTVGEFDS